jgi:hypothetical protein
MPARPACPNGMRGKQARSRRHDRRGGRACKQFSESSRDLAAVLGDHVCISHRRARIGVTEAILSAVIISSFPSDAL